jgi:hypothetical protein
MTIPKWVQAVDMSIEGSGGATSPLPGEPGASSWTHTVVFAPVASTVYATTALQIIGFDTGGGGAGGGIVEYTTGAKSVPHPVGESDPNLFAPYLWAANVNSVTFGWNVNYLGEGSWYARIHNEIWW